LPARAASAAVLTSVLLAGCGAEPSQTEYRNDELGVYFDFPEGWRRLQASELPPGKESLVTIEDSTGLASVSLVEFDLQAVLGTLDTQLMLQMAGEGNVNKALALFVQLNSTFEDLFEQRYERYELLDREWVRALEGQQAVASDIVFQGRLPGEPLTWRKATIILVAGQDEKGFIMAYAVPSLALEDYVDAFQFVEDSWRTTP
jgi:hypothetical protein